MKYKKESLKEFVATLTDKQREKIKDWNDELGTFEIDESVLNADQKEKLVSIMSSDGYTKLNPKQQRL